MPKRLKPTRVRLGSDFAGLDSGAFALQLLGLPFERTFACDAAAHSLKVLSYGGAQHIFTDITQRALERTPAVDLYLFGPPCQPFSTSGQREGLNAADGCLALHSLAYILHHRPSMIVMEQVPNVLKVADDMMTLIFSELRTAGYSLSSKLIRSDAYGVPQMRERLYLVGVRFPVSEFRFPDEVPCPPVASFIDPLPAGRFQVLPEGASQLRARNVEEQIEKRVNSGVNPLERAVFVASGASSSRCHSTVDVCMTITRTEAARLGYWCSLKGGFLEARELGRLQGFPDDLIPWKDLEISESQFGALVGNAMSLNVLMHLLPCVLRSGGFITEDACRSCLQAAVRFHPVQCPRPS